MFDLFGDLVFVVVVGFSHVCLSVRLLGVVVTIGVVGRMGCLSLVLTKSLSRESHVKHSCAVANQGVPFVKSLLSL